MFEGRNDEAQRLVDANFICKGPGSGGAQWGCYQTMGNLALDFSYVPTPANSGRDLVDSGHGPLDSGRGLVDYSAFARGLSLDSAIALYLFSTVNGVAFTREYFTSFSGDVGVIRITADKPGQDHLRLVDEQTRTGGCHGRAEISRSPKDSWPGAVSFKWKDSWTMVSMERECVISPRLEL